ncbi:MAG: ChaN family lipoprotein [Candidatus Brocadiaceae bacterium]|nr:ChaN family lipoprotein [Candidatus Brocadiaceae bacterium]
MTHYTTSVSIFQCEHYDKEKVSAVIEKTFDSFGGIRSFIKKGSRVLLKPNFIKESRPDECTITHPVIIEAIAEKVLAADAIPIIGDSPAFGSLSRIIHTAGLNPFIQELGIKVVELDEPRRVKTMCGAKPFSLKVSGKVLDMDAIINIPKLKAHVQFLYTASIKNMYGCVCGKSKAWRHFISNDDLTWYTEMLLANHQAVKPVFTIVDAITAMEKYGPSGGVPKQVSLILGGIDDVAIDRVIAEIIRVHPSQVPLLQTAKLYHIGEQSLNKIKIIGEQISSVEIHNFELPRLIPIGFNPVRIVKSLAKHYWLKNFGRTFSFLFAFYLLMPQLTFSDEGMNRSKHFPRQVSVNDIIHVPTGVKIQFSDLTRFFDCADILYVGETHAHMESHKVQLQVLKACYEKYGDSVAIGMEMFTRPYQPFLDQWVAGEIDEKKMLEDTNWDHEWGYDYALYKELLDYAREKKIPLVALNAPKALVRMVSEKGLDALTEEEKKELPEIDTTGFFHRVYLEKAISGHTKGLKNIEKYNDVQCLWEEFMAQTIVDYLSSWEGKDRKFLVFAGNGHIVYDFGIPKRVFRRTFMPYYTIYPADFKGKEPNDEHSLFLSDVPLEPADFVWITPQIKQKKRIVLGVHLQKRDDNKLFIEQVSKGGPAEKTGILQGDYITSIDGKELENIMDLIHYLQTKQFGDICMVEVDRDGTKITYAVDLFEMEM